MTAALAQSLMRSLATLPLFGAVISGFRPASADGDRRAVAGALAAAGAWFFQIDARHIIREVFPITAVARAALLGRDIRSFIDPLDPLNEHPRMARAFLAREPFRDLVMPFELGSGRRLLRVSGEPTYDPNGDFTGYRGLAIDAATAPARPDADVSLIAPDLQHALINTLGVVMGFAQFLAQDAASGSAQADYAARILVAAGTARDIVAASRTASGLPASYDDPCAPRPLTDAAAPARRIGRVLLVHEVPQVGDLLSIAFERVGFEAAVCRDGAEAIEVLNEDPALWDVLVTTAAGSAPGAAALIRHARALKPGLLCVVCDEPEAAVLAEAEADLFWPKPADAMALAGMIRAQLDG
ncbi:MAG: response regulator [Proteobacteria bacterium]|nr:response regulator [Pseudomonadota bacterium]